MVTSVKSAAARSVQLGTWLDDSSSMATSVIVQ
jgi:hypothetical protein